MNVISSSRNDRVKLVKQLQSRSRARRKFEQLVLEGVRLIDDALENGPKPVFALADESAIASNASVSNMVDRLEWDKVTCLRVTPDVMQEMTDTDTPQGILAVFPLPKLTIPKMPELVLVLDGWRDPGNVGTLLRTAAAAGVPVVAVTPGTVDPFNPKVLRAGMGAHYRVPLLFIDWTGLPAKYPNHALYLADMSGETAYDAVDWSQQPALVAVGEEAHGLSKDARALPHTVIHIPMQADAESLNAAVSASLIVYAARRHALG